METEIAIAAVVLLLMAGCFYLRWSFGAGTPGSNPGGSISYSERECLSDLREAGQVLEWLPSVTPVYPKACKFCHGLTHIAGCPEAKP